MLEFIIIDSFDVKPGKSWGMELGRWFIATGEAASPDRLPTPGCKANIKSPSGTTFETTILEYDSRNKANRIYAFQFSGVADKEIPRLSAITVQIIPQDQRKP